MLNRLSLHFLTNCAFCFSDEKTKDKTEDKKKKDKDKKKEDEDDTDKKKTDDKKDKKKKDKKGKVGVVCFCQSVDDCWLKTGLRRSMKKSFQARPF